jgi:hypothetical protein
MYARGARRCKSRENQRNCDSAIQGQVDANAARLTIDAQKWLAAKEMPRRYSDHLNIEANIAVIDIEQ